ncbi:hypothetical protein D9M72_528200 [compost metagenome]
MTDLHVARRHVVDHRIAEDMLHRRSARDVLAALADDDGELGLVVDLGRDLGGNQHVVMRADHAFRHLGKDDRPLVGLCAVVLEDRGREFLGMRVIVAPNAPEISTRLGQRRVERYLGHLDPGTGR